jgi:hypothetical protein
MITRLFPLAFVLLIVAGCSAQRAETPSVLAVERAPEGILPLTLEQDEMLRR